MYTIEKLAENIDRQCKMIKEYGQRLKNKRNEKQNNEKE
jgi:hypothetical protein